MDILPWVCSHNRKEREKKQADPDGKRTPDDTKVIIGRAEPDPVAQQSVLHPNLHR